jgi:carbon-monoxide dehydrogenase medium subunit
MQLSYLEPASMDEAVRILAEHENSARVIAGGTDLVRQLQEKSLVLDYLVSLELIPLLDRMRYTEAKGLSIGTLVPIRELERSEKFDQGYVALSQAAQSLGSRAIRNVATIGGNLCNAAPCADTAPPLIGLSAKVTIAGTKGNRALPLEEFFRGPGQTVLGAGDVLVEIQVPPSAPGARSAYLKHTRSPIDLAVVGVAVVLTTKGDRVCNDARIVLGSVAPTPIRARRAEDLLRGEKLSPSLVARCASMAASEAKPISDVRATAEYRMEIISVLVRRALEQVIQE